MKTAQLREKAGISKKAYKRALDLTAHDLISHHLAKTDNCILPPAMPGPPSHIQCRCLEPILPFKFLRAVSLSKLPEHIKDICKKFDNAHEQRLAAYLRRNSISF